MFMRTCLISCIRRTNIQWLVTDTLHSVCSLYLRPHGVVAGGILFYSRSFFLSFFSFAKGSSRWLYRQGTFIAQKVGYRCSFIKLVRNLGADPPVKIWGPENPQFRSIFGRSPTLPVHCSRTEQDIANLKTDF